MQKTFTTKLFIIGTLCFLFGLGMVFINSLVYERSNYHQSVMEEIKTMHAGDQFMIAPFLLVGDAPIFAQSSNIAGTSDVQDDKYRRGIYHAISHQSSLDISQKYKPITPPKTEDNDATPVSLIIPISDLRGASNAKITINGKEYPTKFNTQGKYHLSYIEAIITDDARTLDKPLNIRTNLNVLGIDSLHIAPTGDNAKVSLAGNWAEPKFLGDALPNNKRIDATGFSADWQNDFLATANTQAIISASECKSECSPNLHNNLNHLAVAFVNTTDTYTLTDRTIKYALLFLVISFGTFFLFETIKKLRIHPLQYGLVASALLMFYVLLLSLAEHIAFYAAYGIAAGACALLIGFYTYYVLDGAKRSGAFTLLLSSLYAGFYFILSIDELNLLLGAVFCFLLLAAVMFITRKVDWYALELNPMKPNQTHQPEGDNHANP